MNKLIRGSFFLLSFSPIIAVLLFGLFSYYWITGGYFIILSSLNILSKLKAKQKIIFPTYIKFLCGAFLYYFIWALSQDFEIQGGLYKFLYKNPVFISIFVFLLVENYQFDSKFIKNMNVIFVVTIVVSFFVSLVQAFYNPDFFMPLDNLNYYSENDTGYGKVRFVSIFGWLAQNDYGLSYLPIVSIVFGTSLLNRNNVNVFLLLMTVIYVILTGGRWIMLGFVVLFCQYIIFKRIKVVTIIRYVFLFAIFLYSSVQILAFIGYDLTMLSERLESKTYESRLLAFELFLKYFPQHPWIGTGVHITHEIANDIAGLSSQIHVGFFSHLVTFGAFGSLFLFGAWASLTYRLFKVAVKTRFYGALFGFLTFLTANLALVDYSIYYYGIVFLVIFSNYYARKAHESNEGKVSELRLRV